MKTTTNIFEIKENINNVTIRLYNANSSKVTGITKDAGEFGFEGLVIVPVIELFATEEVTGVIQITKRIIDELGLDEEAIFNKAIANTKYTIKSMRDVLIGCMFPNGIITEEDREMTDMMLPPDDGRMWIVSNPSQFLGASSIIPALPELKERFDDGFIVLPSSIHEVIVLTKGDEDEETLNEMVRDINAGVVAEEERLSDDIYVFETA